MDSCQWCKKNKPILNENFYLCDDCLSVVTPTIFDEFIALDIETTGLRPTYDKIIEIGAVRVSNGAIVEKFRTFVDPGIHIPYYITNINGITDKMVKGAPAIEDALPKYLEFASDLPVIAHNAQFDMSFIRHNSGLLGVTLSNKVIDTLLFCRKMLRDIENHKLDTVSNHFGIRLENHHRAIDDCIAAAHIYLKCVENLKIS